MILELLVGTDVVGAATVSTVKVPDVVPMDSTTGAVPIRVVALGALFVPNQHVAVALIRSSYHCGGGCPRNAMHGGSCASVRYSRGVAAVSGSRGTV